MSSVEGSRGTLKTCWGATRVVTSAVFLAVAGMASFYAGFCLLGGPDGAILSRDSFLFGVPPLLVAVSLTYASSRLVPAKLYVYAPALAPLAAWLGAIAVSQEAGFYLWVAGIPASFVATLAYWIVSQVLNAVHEHSP
jgi:uncharacterized membrane protein